MIASSDTGSVSPAADLNSSRRRSASSTPVQMFVPPVPAAVGSNPAVGEVLEHLVDRERRQLHGGADRLAVVAARQLKKPYDHARHVAALRARPASWAPERAQRKLESAHRHRSRAGKRRR